MDLSEGLRRAAKVTRWLGIAFAAVALFVCSYEAIEPAMRGGRFQTEALVVGVLVAVVVYFFGAAAAWVIEGFARKE